MPALAIQTLRAALTRRLGEPAGWQLLLDMATAHRGAPALPTDDPAAAALVAEVLAGLDASDPLLLGWLLQHWRQAERDELDAIARGGGRIALSQVPVRTQLFTEHYMARWILENTLGAVWRARCRARGWPAAMPAGWGLWVERKIPDDVVLVDALPSLRVLDPSCGAGHFLIVAAELLADLYQQEAALTGARWSRAQIATWIATENLWGVELDRRALAVAQAGLARVLGVAPTHLLHAPGPLGSLAQSPAILGGALAEGRYHVVVGNPPYQSTRQLVDTRALAALYPAGRADLLAAFLLQSLRLTAPGGVSGQLTQRSWMFTAQFAPLREALLGGGRLDLLADLGAGAFSHIRGQVVSVAMSLLWRLPPGGTATSVSVTAHTDPASKAAALRHATGRPFSVQALSAIAGWPLLHRWSAADVQRYLSAPLLGDVVTTRQGMATGDNARFLRKIWEVRREDVALARFGQPRPERRWVPYVKGAAGREWLEPVEDVLDWADDGRVLKALHTRRYGSYSKRIPSEGYMFTPAVSFTRIGARPSARAVRYQSAIDVAGSAAFTDDQANLTCLLSSTIARRILCDLNPTMNFQVGDVRRLPYLQVDGADAIFARLTEAFEAHERGRETAPELVAPGPSCWRYAMRWAQRAVDRPPGAPLPPWQPVWEAPSWQHRLSHAVGVALGRFPGEALPESVLLLDGPGDDLDHPAAAPIHAAWAGEGSLRRWLQRDFFPTVHRPMYAGRPIHFLLCSPDRAVVVLLCIHQHRADTLPRLVARLAARGHHQFAADVARCAGQGPGGQRRDAAFAPVLDDGVLINAAPLWPVLDARWKAPGKTWAKLAAGALSWSAAAGRYFPQ